MRSLRESAILSRFHSKSNQGGLLCRAVRQVSSQLAKLSGNLGRKKCRDPNPHTHTSTAPLSPWGPLWAATDVNASHFSSFFSLPPILPQFYQLVNGHYPCWLLTFQSPYAPCLHV